MFTITNVRFYQRRLNLNLSCCRNSLVAVRNRYKKAVRESFPATTRKHTRSRITFFVRQSANSRTNRKAGVICTRYKSRARVLRSAKQPLELGRLSGTPCIRFIHNAVRRGEAKNSLIALNDPIDFVIFRDDDETSKKAETEKCVRARAREHSSYVTRYAGD